MLKVIVSEATFESPEYSDWKVNLSGFYNPERGNIEFVYKTNKKYSISYTRFTAICELIFLSVQLSEKIALPTNTKVKQFINTEENDVAVIVDIVAKTISIGYMYSTENGNVLEKDSFNYIPFGLSNALEKDFLNYIPFGLFNLLNKTIDRDIILPSQLGSDD